MKKKEEKLDKEVEVEVKAKNGFDPDLPIKKQREFI